MKNNKGLLKSFRRFIRDYASVLKSGVFLHGPYCRRYLANGRCGGDLLSPLALPHYLIRGEARGNWPNPFFDPSFFARQAPQKRLADYLSDSSLWRLPLSTYFDPGWYMRGDLPKTSSRQSPLVHFWKRGFEQGLSPTPRFDTPFFRHAIARDARDKKRYAYSYLSQADLRAPLNGGELAELQQRFYESIKLETLKYAETPASDVLVFVQAGRDFRPTIFDDAPFDVLVNFYEQARPVDAQYVFHQPGTKITAVRKILEMWPELLLKYRSILFLDDDVEISQQQIGRLFETQARDKLDLIQASLSPASSSYYPVLKQPFAGPGLRRVTGIEIMMPLISRRALETCGWVFGEGISGWGIDILLSTEVRKRFGNSIGVLGDVVVAHPRPTDTKNNAFYKFLAQYGINPTVEAGHITLKFGLKDSPNFIHFDDERF